MSGAGKKREPESLRPELPIVIIDDEEGILLSLDTVLRMAGLNNIITMSDGRKLKDLLADQPIELLILDLLMPEVKGEDLLTAMAAGYPETPVIVVTGVFDAETAVRCMKGGAFDYLVKPVEESRFVSAVEKALEFRRLKRENQALRRRIMKGSLEHPEAFEEIITQDPKMLSIFQYVEAVAPSEQPVLITGETGVGKELIARALHRLSGRPGEMVAVNVAGLDDNVFTDTLFGHAKGAFTGADKSRSGLVSKASRGTLFLDEIGDLSPASQAKLLRLLQEGEYLPLGRDDPQTSRARIVAATNRNLWALESAGDFRTDLNYRVRTHHIHLPPLRERTGDLPLLLDHFLKQASSSLGRKKPRPAGGLTSFLKNNPFPGNIRELQSAVFDAVSRTRGDVLKRSAFQTALNGIRPAEPQPAPGRDDPAEPFSHLDELPSLKTAAKMLVDEALRRSGGNQTAAAKILGISQQALSKRLKNS